MQSSYWSRVLNRRVGRRRAILGDLQRYLAEKCYTVGSPGNASEFDLSWPAVRRHLTYQQDSRSITSYYYNWWLDDTKAPLA